MVDSADIYFIQHFADIYFSKSVCISACWGYQVSRTYCQVSFNELGKTIRDEALLSIIDFP